MNSYDYFVTVIQPEAYDKGLTVGLIEDYLTEPYRYEGDAELAFSEGFAQGSKERAGYAAEELLVIAHEFEFESLPSGPGAATIMAALKYGRLS